MNKVGESVVYLGEERNEEECRKVILYFCTVNVYDAQTRSTAIGKNGFARLGPLLCPRSGLSADAWGV